MKEKDDCLQIFNAGVDKVDPYKIIKNGVILEDNKLKISAEDRIFDINISVFSEIIVIGAGKATAKMALGIENVLGKKIAKGVISVKYGHLESLDKIEIIQAGHPVPDEKSVEAAKKIVKLCEAADEKTLVINLISGGGSSLLELPYRDDETELTLSDIQLTTKELLACGASIEEINCIRKHLSLIKGGRLADYIFPAKCITLILSDVNGDRLDSIASGMTVPDTTSYQNVSNIVESYRLIDKLPEPVQNVIKKGSEGLISDTPDGKSEALSVVTNILIGNNISALRASAVEAKKLGYNTRILTSQLSGEAREIAKIFSSIAKDIKAGKLKEELPLCIITGGETTVTLTGNGKGGRNQEMVLSFLNEMYPYPGMADKVLFFSGGTDGNDGPTDAAGAIFTADLLNRCIEKKLNPGYYLKNNDSYNFFKQIDGLIITGPTNTNVCDIQILLIG